MKKESHIRLKTARLFLVCCLVSHVLTAQEQRFTREDSVRGSITHEREWWDLLFYHLKVKVDPDSQSFSGSNLVRYRVLQPSRRLQIDLQAPLRLTKVTQDGNTLSFDRDGNAWFINLVKPQREGQIEELLVYYEGQPKVAVRPPWDGGVQWVKDQSGKPFIATACQGIGASVWWPCKDHMYDEPDSMRISVNVPAGLSDVSNGRLAGIDSLADGSRTFHWVVRNPINNYGVNLNIAGYTSWKETYEGEKGRLDLSYYVLPANEGKARVHFRQVPMMLKAFEYWFGPYPFYEDGFKLVEVPYLGMEHQSSVTYGNRYANGYLGRDLSQTGWGLKFDFIIIHESGHEWFANNITYRDIADMWIHESFTTYSESLFLEYHYGKQAADEYMIGSRNLVQNEARIMGIFGVNHRGSGDMYAKGANMLHTIRQVVNDDDRWRKILRGLNTDFYHSTVDGSQVIDYINRNAGRDFTPVFRQYLEDIRIPQLQYVFKNGTLHYRWSQVMQGFDLPLRVQFGDGSEAWLQPEAGKWKTIRTRQKTLSVDPNFYVTAKQLPSLSD